MGTRAATALPGVPAAASPASPATAFAALAPRGVRDHAVRRFRVFHRMTNSPFDIAAATRADIPALVRLYRDVAAIEGGLARAATEITDGYVGAFVDKALTDGVILVAREAGNGPILGEIHAYAPGPAAFAHMLGDLTVAVHPRSQGRGIGRALFSACLRQVREGRPWTRRVELFVRESNTKAIAFYESLGLVAEGRLLDRIRSASGGYEADIVMAWTPRRP